MLEPLEPLSERELWARAVLEAASMILVLSFVIAAVCLALGWL